MNALRRSIGLLRDSPTYGRDRATLISGLTIGTTGLLLNGAVLMCVLPLMLDPDDRDFRSITEKLEFGQVLALILLGGATVFATFLIPLRLLTVFWGARVGRYFDQIVLSGISPLRFVIGKATSQNLFLGLILFLLVPYLVLSLTLGGIDLMLFVAGLFLIWLYCMALSLVTLWMTLYFNELLAAMVVIVWAMTLCILGCFPMSPQPFVLTPFPVLTRSVYAAMPYGEETSVRLLPLFAASTVSMTVLIGIALVAIRLGPLYGIIRENSTFGEVVRTGDAKRKRWFRLRLHIQRPSEIAFFYENRGEAYRGNEGLLRWGLGLLGLLLLWCAAYLTFAYSFRQFANWGTGVSWWAYQFHGFVLMIQGFALALAALLFSHAKNSTYLRVPFAFGRRVEVARLDTAVYFLFAALVTGAAIATPFLFEHYLAAPQNATVFPSLQAGSQGSPTDFSRVATEGPLVLAVAGLTIYALQRLACLAVWTKIAAFAGVAGLYVALSVPPLVIGLVFREAGKADKWADSRWLADFAPTLIMMSPIGVLAQLFSEMRLPPETSAAPFFVVHGVLIVLALLAMRRAGRSLRSLYLTSPSREGT